MSILGSAKYRIEHFIDRGTVSPDAVYVDSFDNLRRVIATTWSKIPHTVNIKGMDVEVTKKGTSELLALFTFKALHDISLPDHL